MAWQTPAFIEIDMSAEIGAYQSDFQPDENPSFVAPQAQAPAGEHDGDR